MFTVLAQQKLKKLKWVKSHRKFHPKPGLSYLFYVNLTGTSD